MVAPAEFATVERPAVLVTTCQLSSASSMPCLLRTTDELMACFAWRSRWKHPFSTQLIDFKRSRVLGFLRSGRSTAVCASRCRLLIIVHRQVWCHRLASFPSCAFSTLTLNRASPQYFNTGLVKRLESFCAVINVRLVLSIQFRYRVRMLESFANDF